MHADEKALVKARRLFRAGLTFKAIGEQVGLAAQTVARHARNGAWKRAAPAGEAPAVAPARKGRSHPAAQKAQAGAMPDTAARCRDMLLRVLAAAEAHLVVVEQRIASPKLDVASREKEVRLIAVLTRLINDINHVLGPAKSEAPRSDPAGDRADDLAAADDRRRQDFALRLEALFGGDPAEGLSALQPEGAGGPGALD